MVCCLDSVIGGSQDLPGSPAQIQKDEKQGVIIGANSSYGVITNGHLSVNRLRQKLLLIPNNYNV